MNACCERCCFSFKWSLDVLVPFQVLFFFSSMIEDYIYIVIVFFSASCVLQGVREFTTDFWSGHCCQSFELEEEDPHGLNLEDDLEETISLGNLSS